LEKEVGTENIQVTLVHPFGYDCTSHSTNKFHSPPHPPHKNKQNNKKKKKNKKTKKKERKENGTKRFVEAERKRIGCIQTAQIT